MQIKKSLIQKIRERWNKDINVIIADKVEDVDLSLFGRFTFFSEVLHYPPETSIGRILIDTGLAKSWSEVKGSHWKDYEIPFGFTDLYLDGLTVWKRDFFGKRPHRLTILRWEKPYES